MTVSIPSHFDQIITFKNSSFDLQKLENLIDPVSKKILIIMETDVHIHILHNQNYFPQLEHIQIACMKSSNLTYSFVSMQSAALTFTLQLHEKSRAAVYGAYALTDDMKISLMTRQEHCAPQAESELVMHGLLSGAAQAQFEGIIKVNVAASGTLAEQQSAHILLSENARSSTKPMLEIEAHEVQCKHGSAVGQLDEEHLFYLVCRGISKGNAQRLLIAAFFERTLHSLPRIEKMLMHDMLLRSTHESECP